MNVRNKHGENMEHGTQTTQIERIHTYRIYYLQTVIIRNIRVISVP